MKGELILDPVRRHVDTLAIGDSQDMWSDSMHERINDDTARDREIRRYIMSIRG